MDHLNEADYHKVDPWVLAVCPGDALQSEVNIRRRLTSLRSQILAFQVGAHRELVEGHFVSGGGVVPIHLSLTAS